MSETNAYIDSLKWKLEQIKKEIAEHQEEIQRLFKIIEDEQEQGKHIRQLLASEGEQLQDSELANLAYVEIAESAYQYLNSLEDQKPLHYTEIAKTVMSQGILISGKNPAANLLSHISRDDRFIRTAPGTYGLKSWGLKPAPHRKKRLRKR
jgi:DNA gyrase/topoisomerase IV subunit A